MDKETWWAAVHGVTESDVTEWLSTQYSIVWYTIFYLSIHPLMDTWVSIFLWITLLKISMFRFLCGCVFAFLLGMYLGMELLSHMVTVQLIEELSDCFPKQLHHFTFSAAMCGDYSFSTYQWHLLLSWFFHSGHPSKMCKMVSWYVFTWCWAFCLVLIGHLCIFLGEVAIQIPCPFLNFLCIYFWLGWVLIVAASRGCSSVAVAQTSHCGGFSLQSMGTRVHRPQ